MLGFKNLFLAAGLLGLSLARTLDKRQDTGDVCRFCVDNVNDCGRMYGGCWDLCKTPQQEFEIPECNGVSGKPSVCEYFKNSCGKTFGGCYPSEGPIPMFADPWCEVTID